MTQQPDTFELVGGPQDGAVLTRLGPMPKIIYCNRESQAEGQVSWTSQPTEELSARYVLKDPVTYVYRPERPYSS